MKRNVGLTYGEFSFPPEQGFTGSAGKSSVKGYMRGGKVKRTGTANAKKGGKMEKYGEGGYYGKPGDKYPKSKARQKMPKNVKARGGSVHDKLVKHGKEMGYAYGGQVKDTSGEFVAKRGKQDTMDSGVQPSRRGAGTRNAQEKEAGGTGRLKPGYKKGGYHQTRYKTADKSKGRGMSKKGMPKNVKAKGGLAEYAKGGYAAGDKKSHPTGRGRKPYSGYNKQPGGSGNEDARYMGKAEGGYAEGGKWIQKAIKKPGALRKSLGVKKGQDIPMKKLRAAAKKPGKMGQRARLAETLRGLGKAKGGSVSVERTARRVANQVMDKHIRADRPSGHGVK